MRPVTVLYVGGASGLSLAARAETAQLPKLCRNKVGAFELDCFEALALTAGIYVGIATRAVSMSLRGHRLTRDSRPEQYDLE